MHILSHLEISLSQIAKFSQEKKKVDSLYVV
jgi:hypothetical protein